MKITFICIPTLDKGGLLSRISMHFGKTSYFTFIKIENGKIKDINVIESAGRHNSSSGTHVDLILDSKAEVVLCGGLGSKARSMLRSGGIDIISGASGRVKDVIDEWKIGMLQLTDENICRNCSRGGIK